MDLKDRGSGNHDGDFSASDRRAWVALVAPRDCVQLAEEEADELVLTTTGLRHGDVVVEDRELHGAQVGRAHGADEGAGAVVAESACFAQDMTGFAGAVQAIMESALVDTRDGQDVT